MSEPSKSEMFEQRFAVFEERMEARQSDFRAEVARIGQAIAEFKIDVLAQLMASKQEAAKRDAELAKRDALHRGEAAKRDAEFKEEAAKRDADLARRDAVSREKAAKRDAEFKEEAAKRDADLARRDADFREELSRRDAASAKREISIVIWMAGLVSVGVAVIGLIVRWPF